MSDQKARALRRNETFIPIDLQRFLVTLEASQTTDQVWNCMVRFYASLGLDQLDYVCATDFRDWEQAQFIRTTVHSDWIDHARDNPNIRKTSYFRTHAVKFLTPIAVGMAYLDVQGEVSPERLEIMRLTKEAGFNAGLGIPLRMTDPGQAGILIVGGGMSRAEFDAILAEHGWAIHTAALSAHTRYTELFKTEFIQRNRLTKKQQELIQLVGHGLMDKQIATELGVSVSAIRQRLSVIQTKTGAQNRADLAALATRIGLVPDPLLKPHTKDLTVFLSTGDGKSGTEYSIERDEPEPGVS